MQILYLHQYFNTPRSGGPLRSYHVAKGMLEAGHKVDMVTSYNGDKIQVKNIDGIKVHYLPNVYDNKMSVFKRLWSFINFMRLTLAYTKNLKADLCFATSTPLTVGVVALSLFKKRKVPYVFEIRDLWPKVPIELGIINTLWPKRFLYWLENKIYKHAQHLIALSPAMQDYIVELGYGHKTTLIPNMSDCSFYEVSKKEKKPFTIGYFGALGYANHPQYIVDIAEKALRQELDLRFVIAGNGKYEDEVYQASQRLSNLEYYSSLKREEVRQELSKTDIVFVCFLKHKALTQNSPNKFFEALAAGKAVVVNTTGWLQELVLNNDCGFYYDPDKPDDFLTLVKMYFDDAELLSHQQKNARALGECEFSREILVKKVLNVL